MAQSDESHGTADGPALRRLAARQKQILARIADLERLVQELSSGAFHPAGASIRREKAAEHAQSLDQSSQPDLTGVVGGHSKAGESAAVGGSERLDHAGTPQDEVQEGQNGQEQIVGSESGANGRQSKAQISAPQITLQKDVGNNPNSVLNGVPAKLDGMVANGSADRGQEIRATQQRLEKICRSLGCQSVQFKAVPEDYYERSLEERRDLLGAPSVDHLCKSIVMVCHRCDSLSLRVVTASVLSFLV